ncbi:MAG: hypothetical protein IPJ77_05750 [Planctomycetes bacterium]|nr:hypothetical protein [Planctomycetota bacterium]
MMKPTLTLLLPVGLLLAACASDASQKKLALAEIEARHATERSRLQDAQDAFARRWKAPFELEFPGEGTVQVHECALHGYEDHVEVFLDYSYVNTTGKPIDGVRIEIDLVDPRTGAARTEETRLTFPPLIPFLPESSFTTVAHVPTRGLHLVPGWEWRIRPQRIVRSRAG